MSTAATFFAELKRRNVIRVAGLYLVGAWLLTQVASTVLPVFDVPSWALRGLIVTLALGFIPTLVFCWAFELTPQGLKRDTEVKPEDSIAPQIALRINRAIIAVLALALVYFCFDKFVLAPQREATQIAQAVHSTPQGSAVHASAAPIVATANSIAVLAFDDLSPAHDQGYFSDGMAEEILNALARIKALKVIARGSSFQFKGKNVSPTQIGAELGVAHILQGSVRKQGKQLRITATLVQAADGVQQWSKTYDGKLADVFDLQESCARDIAAELKVVLAGNGEQRLVEKSTDNADAYALFIEAQTLVNARVGDSLPRAIVLLEKATALDPKFARAWSKLAVAHAVLPQYVGGDWVANLKLAESDAQHAIALDADNAEAYAALGYVALSRRRYVDMVAPSQRALALDPDDVTANFWASNQLAATGRSTEAEANIDHILVRDPANAPVLFNKSILRWTAGDTAAALALATRSEALGMSGGAWILSRISAINGDYDHGAPQFAHGLAALGVKFTSAQLETIYRGIYFSETQHAAAMKVIAARNGDQYAPTLLIMLGESERSFASFEHNATGLSDAYLDFLWEPDAWSRKARQSPAFQGFAKRIGLLDYWKKNRWPDLCSPTPEKGPDAFACR